MTDSTITISQARPDEAGELVEMVDRLLEEMGGGPSGLDLEAIQQLCCTWLAEDGQYAAFLARDGEGGLVGLITVYDLAMLHARGRMGVIAELYVDPRHRRQGIGKRLMEAAYAFGRRRAWQRIEVSAPSVEDLPETVAFYEGEGFWEKGPLMARRFDL